MSNLDSWNEQTPIKKEFPGTHIIAVSKVCNLYLLFTLYFVILQYLLAEKHGGKKEYFEKLL